MSDKPRKIVVCHPDNVRRIQSGLVEKGITDVLVKPDIHGVVDIDQSYVMDPLPEIMTGEEMQSVQRVWRESMDDLRRSWPAPDNGSDHSTEERP